ncbi:MAG TPA: hypothetical protein VNM90_19395 [Haliangium sp.]|nr:hypothetical protein [Haliangium sp.]
MIITIADAVFAAVESASDRLQSSRLLSLLLLGDEGRHRILIDPLYEPNAARHVNRWLARRDRETREAIELTLDFGTKAEAGFPLDVEIRVDDVPTPDWKHSPPVLPLEDALRLARRPLVVLVEDLLNDGMFLRAIASEKYWPRFGEAVRNDWINVAHGGGIESIERRVTEIMVTEGQAGQPDACLRMWIMFDSDAIDPRAPSKSSERLKRKCEESKKPIRYHQLKRRAIENYLPRQALDNYTREAFPGGKERSGRQVFKAYYAMEPLQRHHYNLKEGFQQDRKRGEKIDLLQHFGDHQNQPELQRGFGKQIWREVCNHPLNLEHKIPPFPVSWLHDDSSREEAEDILRSLLQRL